MNRSAVSFFDARAGEWSGHYGELSAAGYALRRRQAALRELLAGAEGRVLDVGCGSGVMDEEVLQRGCTLWGVDASAQMIAECRQRFGKIPRAHFSVGDAMALPFADGVFDLVLCVGVIHYLVPPEAAIAEMQRVLKPGGTLLLGFPNRLSPYVWWRRHVWYSLVRCLKQSLSALDGRPRPMPSSRSALWSPRVASGTVERLAGPVRRIAYYNVQPLLSPLDELLPALAVRLAQRLEPLGGSWLRWLGSEFVVQAVKAG